MSETVEVAFTINIHAALSASRWIYNTEFYGRSYFQTQKGKIFMGRQHKSRVIAITAFKIEVTNMKTGGQSAKVCLPDLAHDLAEAFHGETAIWET